MSGRSWFGVTAVRSSWDEYVCSLLSLKFSLDYVTKADANVTKGKDTGYHFVFLCPIILISPMHLAKIVPKQRTKETTAPHKRLNVFPLALRL